MKWWVVNKNSHALIALCDEIERPLPSIGLDQALLQVPEGVAPGNCKVLDTDGVLFLVDGSADKAGPAWDKIRSERNARLAACDWTMLPDADLTKAEKDSWKAYRKTLKDLPANTEDPENVVFPVKAE